MQVECLVCGKTFSYDEDNTGILLDHLNQDHSNTEVFQYLAKKGKKQRQAESYLTSYDCPFCCKTGTPLLKKTGKSGLMQLFWCWPFCCYLDPAQKVNLYCSHCSKYGGYYDRKAGKLVRVKSE